MSSSGASAATILTLQAKELNFKTSGAASLKILNGAAEYLTIQASGASAFNGKGLLAERVDARASGAAKIKVHANESLETKSSGASDIKNSGPAKRD